MTPTAYKDHMPMLRLRVMKYTESLDANKSNDELGVKALEAERQVYRSLMLAEKHGMDVVVLCDMVSRTVSEPTKSIVDDLIKEAMEGKDFTETYNKFLKSDEE